MTLNNIGNAPASLENGNSTPNSRSVRKNSLHRQLCRKLPPELVRALWRQACLEDDDLDERVFWFASMVLEADDSMRKKAAKIEALYREISGANVGIESEQPRKESEHGGEHTSNDEAKAREAAPVG